MGSFEPPPRPLFFFKYRMKMKLFGLSETKLFHFHGIFKKNEINSSKPHHTVIHMNPLSRNLDPNMSIGLICIYRKENNKKK